MKIQDPHRSIGRILLGKAPIEAQLVVTRRCNLSCGYCTEFDDHSAEVPFLELTRSIDALHRLGIINITLLGGEPLLHSRIVDVVRYANQRSQVSITTNGFLLSDALIEELNRAGLSNMQLSIDAMESDSKRYVQKTFKSLRPKLERLAESAEFGVHCNLVLCQETLAQFDEVADALKSFPFAISVNLVHDGHGQVQVEGERYLQRWHDHFDSGRALSFIEREYGAALLRGARPKWQCRAGSRYLYVDEFGKVQFCSSQRGRLDKPIVEFGRADLDVHARTTKGCEAGCSIFCVYRVSQVDNAPMHALVAVAQAAIRGGFLHTKQQWNRATTQHDSKHKHDSKHDSQHDSQHDSKHDSQHDSQHDSKSRPVRSPHLRVHGQPQTQARATENSDSASASDLAIPRYRL